VSAAGSKEDRLPTGIEGFDKLAEGGFPRGDLVLLAGHPGSGKTMFSAQYLHHGASKLGEPGIYVSFAENREAFLRNMRRTHMDFEKLEEKSLFKFVDLITVSESAVEETLTTIMRELETLKAKRLVIDSFSAMSQAFTQKIEARIILHTILGKMTRLSGVTTLLIAEKQLGSDALGGGMEEFVSDAVIVLTQSSMRGHLIRNIDIFKMRGTNASRARHHYEITENGMIVYPSLDLPNSTKTYTEKVSTGIEGFDRMLTGGPYKGSLLMTLGESGTGKTSMALQFMANGAEKGERTLFVSFEESEKELIRHGQGLGWKVAEYIDKGLVKILSYSIEPYNTDKIFAEIEQTYSDFRPARFVLDCLTSVQSALTPDEFLQRIKRMAAVFKEAGTTSIVTARTKEEVLPSAFWPSYLADVIVSLKQVESSSALRRALVIFKTRGMPHDPTIREFEIGSRGIVVAEKFADMEQIMGDSARKSARVEGWSDAFGGPKSSRTGAKS